MQQIRHALGGVVDVALEVDQRGLLLQHALGVAVGHGVDDVVHVLVALADVHVVADADDVRHEGHHVRRLAHRLAVGDLALAFVQVLDLQAQQVARRREGEARAGGVVAEQRNAQAGVEDAGGDVGLAQAAQGVRHREHGRQLVIGLFPGQEKVAVVHRGEIELAQGFEISLELGVHSRASFLENWELGMDGRCRVSFTVHRCPSSPRGTA